jgi:hypothetical protein
LPPCSSSPSILDVMKITRIGRRDDEKSLADAVGHV